MIEVKNVYKSFNGTVVLEDISATFEKGKTNLIIGGSGSGKTVLMKCMVGLHEVDKGKVLYNDRNFSKMDFSTRKEIRQEIGMIFQGGALFDSLNVEQNVIFPLNIQSDMSTKDKLERANFVLKRVNLKNVNKLMPSEISGGMKKRVAIARAIAAKPQYLFCDEPNSGLDPQTSQVIDNLIKEITLEYEITTVINTHDMNSVIEIGDKVIYLYKGKKHWEGNKEEIVKTDNKELNDFIFASKAMQKMKG
ncbi:MAG: ATP-binding cassette domain-containing protein [Nitrosopumilus sp.]|nr:ATP-binding cassette domain-containing protein [Nitrosopumilus sp.]